MKCPSCGVDDNRVIGHGITTPNSYKRYRRCLYCGRTFKTVEYASIDFPLTSDGRILKTTRKRRKFNDSVE